MMACRAESDDRTWSGACMQDSQKIAAWTYSNGDLSICVYDVYHVTTCRPGVSGQLSEGSLVRGSNCHIGIGLGLGLELGLGLGLWLEFGLGLASNFGICTTTFQTNGPSDNWLYRWTGLGRGISWRPPAYSLLSHCLCVCVLADGTPAGPCWGQFVAPAVQLQCSRLQPAHALSANDGSWLSHPAGCHGRTASRGSLSVSCLSAFVCACMCLLTVAFIISSTTFPLCSHCAICYHWYVNRLDVDSGFVLFSFFSYVFCDPADNTLQFFAGAD